MNGQMSLVYRYTVYYFDYKLTLISKRRCLHNDTKKLSEKLSHQLDIKLYFFFLFHLNNYSSPCIYARSLFQISMLKLHVKLYM